MGNTTTDALRDVMAMLAKSKEPNAGPYWQARFEAKSAIFMETHGPEIERALSVLARYGAAAEGEVVEVGDDDEGQPRALVHSTRDELRKGPALAFKRVRLVAAGEG